MKKLLAFIVFFLFPTVLMADGWGDVNNDGKVDEIDITEIKDYLLGKPSANFKVDNADLNKDGNVNVVDIVALIEYFKERAALMDLYNATDGEHWSKNTNWGSDKPLSEWYGIETFSEHNLIDNGYDGNVVIINLADNNLSGHIPESISAFKSLISLSLSYNNLSGEIPDAMGDLSSLIELNISHNQLAGTIPESLCKLKKIKLLWVDSNKLSGSYPEYLTSLMDKVDELMDFGIWDNDFSGKIPDAIANHSRFNEFWFAFLHQRGELDLTGLTIPAPDFELPDMDGVVFKSSELYSKNKLTLLYRWEPWCMYSNAFNEKLIPAYNQFHDKGFEVLGFSVLCGWAIGQCVDEETYRDYLKEKSVPWHNVWQNGNSIDDNPCRLPLFYSPVSSVPLTILVDQNGTIISQSLAAGGYESYEEIIPRLEEFFGEEVDYSYYTSTDYSHDGEVLKLQTATEGDGVDIVFLGEAFTDKDMASGGLYERRMNEAMEQFFSYEPYISLRNRFNVYAVKAVSPNEEFGEGTKHAIEKDNETAFKYALKAVGDNPERLLVGVIYKGSLDRSYCSMYDDGSCVAYVMNMDGPVVNHELGGHGIAQLRDEYVESGNEYIELPEAKKEEMNLLWKVGAAVNVDYHNEPSEIKWAHFLNDPRYSDEVGIYEGSFLYGKGAYRPSMNSMMRYSDCGFNAPSRESIYKHVMKYSDPQWSYDYETFVTFDAPGREAFKSAATRNMTRGQNVQRKRNVSLPPIMYKGSWRDAGKNH